MHHRKPEMVARGSGSFSTRRKEREVRMSQIKARAFGEMVGRQAGWREHLLFCKYPFLKRANCFVIGFSSDPSPTSRYGAVFPVVLSRKDERVFPPMVSVSLKVERAVVNG